MGWFVIAGGGGNTTSLRDWDSGLTNRQPGGGGVLCLAGNSGTISLKLTIAVRQHVIDILCVLGWMFLRLFDDALSIEAVILRRSISGNYSGHHPCMCLEGLRNTTQILSQNSLYPKRVPLE